MTLGHVAHESRKMADGMTRSSPRLCSRGESAQLPCPFLSYVRCNAIFLHKILSAVVLSRSTLSRTGDHFRPSIFTGRIFHSCCASVLQELRQICTTPSLDIYIYIYTKHITFRIRKVSYAKTNMEPQAAL